MVRDEEDAVRRGGGAREGSPAAPDALSGFHPSVARWFAETVGAPTEPQRRGWPAIARGEHVLLAAPTGTGKTLAAFLWALDGLLRQGPALRDATSVLYVSPLRALSNDVQKNLARPLAELAGRDPSLPDVRVLVRTGDTSARERASMVKRKPHVLVTTPESLGILLTSEGGRSLLAAVRTVIVDEIHALARDKRGSHLALSLERLEALAGPVQRIGLSATVRPVEQVARLLAGEGRPCTIVDTGHLRHLDLDVEVPGAPLAPVCSHEQWAAIHARMAELVREHRTTLLFVNTRKLAERLAARLTEILGEDQVACHHGSLSKELRLSAEQRLKAGSLRALVATASLELGIDIGDVDLVIQVGAARSIATLLQRVGRAGHGVHRTPKGRLFPLTLDELAEAAALLAAARRGDLDRTPSPPPALDILAQVIVAATVTDDWSLDELYALVRRAHPYRELPRQDFDAVVALHARGRHALLHVDGVNGRVAATKRARLPALTSGGAIPDTADYEVRLEPEGLLVGTLNEDFAIEANAGDIFQLGNTSWRILRVQPGVVRVADAKGEPPTLPFWLGEAPARTRELSAEIARQREELAELAAGGTAGRHGPASHGVAATKGAATEGAAMNGAAANGAGAARKGAATEGAATNGAARGGPVPGARPPHVVARAPAPSTVGDAGAAPERLLDPGAAAAAERLMAEAGLSAEAASELSAWLAEGRAALGCVPTQARVVAERFFDETGGMQLVLHAPFGGRINRAWGLALRKRFCRGFGFELQAAANEEAILISLGPHHSFPLADVFRFLSPKTARDVLVQALLAAPMFTTRWRWNVTRSLLLPRTQGGKRVPPALLRMRADDLLVTAFPEVMACGETLPPGDLPVPLDHPIVRQTIDDCLVEAMDVDGLLDVLSGIESGAIETVALDRPEPSPFARGILAAQPYTFLDDAPLEERRTQAVRTRRGLDRQTADTLGALDPAAVETVREQAWPRPAGAEEVHEALLWMGYVTEAEGAAWQPWLQQLQAAGRVQQESGRFYATEASRDPVDVLGGRLEALGPVFADDLGPEHAEALAQLEARGLVLRTRLGGRDAWCNRRLLARIHRLTLETLRAEIEPVSAADFLRFLAAWQHVLPDRRVEGPRGVVEVVRALAGWQAPAAAWERALLPVRVSDYRPSWLDELMLSGEVGWGRLWGAAAGTLKSTPVALFPRDELEAWLGLAGPGDLWSLSGSGRQVHEVLSRHGACFPQELVRRSGLLPAQVDEGLAQLVGLGLATCDGFGGLRELLRPRRRGARAVGAGRPAGRWSLFRHETLPAPPVAHAARVLLRRTGVVFRRLLERERLPVSWQLLQRELRRMEVTGEVRGGRFVAGFAGEQFALPEAVTLLRQVRRERRAEDTAAGRTGGLPDERPAVLRALAPGGFPSAAAPVAVHAADPLNLLGILTPDERVASNSDVRIAVQ